MRRPDAVLLIVMITAGAMASGHAQQVPVFRATADLVEIDVSVLDRNPQPVRGLTAATFSVLGGGIEEPLVASRRSTWLIACEPMRRDIWDRLGSNAMLQSSKRTRTTRVSQIDARRR